MHQKGKECFCLYNALEPPINDHVDNVPIALGKNLKKNNASKLAKKALKHCSNFQNSVQKSFKGLKHSLGEFISMTIFLPNGPTVGYIIMFRAPVAQAS